MDRRLDRIEVEMRDGFGSLRSTMVRFGVSVNAALIGVIAAVLIRGG